MSRALWTLLTLFLAALFAARLLHRGSADITPIFTGEAGVAGYPTMADLWVGQAHFVLDVDDTNLPMGESETLLLVDGTLRSYLHASHDSAGVKDACGDPVPFPGCAVTYYSQDGGVHFDHLQPLICQFQCRECPCTSIDDHVDQQQYPAVAVTPSGWLLVYEYRGRTMLRRSPDGVYWTQPEAVGDTGHWHASWRPCSDLESVGRHPFAPHDFDCLAGAPPGIYVEDDQVYVFVALGQNPGHLGCFTGHLDEHAERYRQCQGNPLITGASSYGDVDALGQAANPFFDFRTISSAEVTRIDDTYYMLYEGVRGPGPNDAGDTQFGLGLARSIDGQIDGRWEKSPANPILIDLPGNVGLGHADLVVVGGQTFLYSSLDGLRRSRLRLGWRQ